MNKYTLKFDDKILEEQYQQVKLSKLRKPIYIGLLVLSFCMISSSIVISFTTSNQYPIRNYINYSYFLFMLIQFIIVFKRPNTVKYFLAISNITTGLLQLNFKEETSAQIYYAQGASFMQLQAVAYFVSDFSDGILQIIFLFAIRLSITFIKIQSFDISTSLIGIASTLFSIIVLYVNDQNSRNEFLSSIQENLWDHSLQLLIKKPHFRVQYNKDFMKIDTISQHLLNAFPAYDEDLCDGCNSRNLLHQYQYQGESLSNFLLTQSHLIQDIIEVQYKNLSFKLRIVCVGLRNLNVIVIYERNVSQMRQYHLPHKICNLLKNHLREQSKSIYQKLFNYGLLSLLLINNLQLKEVELISLLKKLNRVHKKSMKPIIFNYQKYIKFYTYSIQLKIFLIQVFYILDSVTKRKITITVNDKEDCVCMQINLKKITQIDLNLIFLNKYHNNMFIESVQQLILINPINEDLSFIFRKQIPYQLNFY